MIAYDDFATVLHFTAALYPRFQLDERTIQAYYTLLGDLDIELLKAAILSLAAKGSPWFPAAGQIRQEAVSLLMAAEGHPTADEAWRQALDWACGGERPRDIFVQEAVRAVGGIRAIGFTDESQLYAIAAQFRKAYEALLNCRREQCLALPQINEIAKRLRGVERPRLSSTREEEE